MRSAIDSLTLDHSGGCLRQRLRDILTCAAALSLCVALLCGCKPQPAPASALQFKVALEPSPPMVGPAKLSIAVIDAQGKPVEGATVRVEGNMNHAGMKPTFADLTEEQPGQYVGTLEFTMGGDWFLLITTTARDGTRTEHKFDVPGVQTQK